jgi:sporulation protein YlmC with PRC-barrel domain
MLNNLKTSALTLALAATSTFAIVPQTHAQVAGSTTVGVTVAEVAEVATGWSVKNNLLGKPVFNEKGDKVGNMEDVIVAPNKAVSYVIVGAGGFVGIGRHDVAIPVARIVQKDGKFVMAGATKDTIRSMPAFDYAQDTSERDQFVAKADQDVAHAKAKLTELEQKSAAASAAAKLSMQKQITGIKHELQSAEGKLSELNRAGVKHWKNFEGEVSAATARLRKWVAGPA